jgi:hypothetical protein
MFHFFLNKRLYGGVFGVFNSVLKVFSNEINPNPIIFLNRPLTFYCYIKGAITVPTEDFKYYHATSWTPSSALPELASCV